MNKEKSDIFIKGIENLHCIRPDEKFGVKESIKIFLFYLFLIIVAKYKKVSEKVFIINGQMEAKKKRVTDGSYEKVYARRFSSLFVDYRNCMTIVSPVRRTGRVSAMMRAIFFNRYGIVCLGRFFEYNLLKEFIKCSGIKEAVSFGHYDEFTLWLAELCYMRKTKYTMYQHGVILDRINVPNKFHCDEIHVYNSYSEEVFRNRIVINDDCQYYDGAFVSNLVFENLDRKEGRTYIGIIDQTFANWLHYVVPKVMEIENCIAVLLLHPLTTDGKPYGMEEKENLIITRNKYFNLDIILTESSTMVLDYVYGGYNGRIISTDLTMKDGFFRDLDLTYIEENSLKDSLLHLIGSAKSDEQS